MNHREPPHLPVGVRRALHCMALVALPALAPAGVQALPRSTVHSAGHDAGTNAKPYLTVAGAPPLRFQEAAPPPDLVTRPPAAAPPTPALTPTESSVALANAEATRSASVTETTPPEAVKTASPLPEKSASAEPASAPASPPAKTPLPILRDDARPAIRPEDFLPYFQLPGSAQHPSDVTLLVPAPKAPPAPAALPNSSATYTQTPK